jgi:hypothetical protein
MKSGRRRSSMQTSGMEQVLTGFLSEAGVEIVFTGRPECGDEADFHRVVLNAALKRQRPKPNFIDELTLPDRWRNADLPLPALNSTCKCLRIHKPNAESPGWPSGLRPSGQ